MKSSTANRRVGGGACRRYRTSISVGEETLTLASEVSHPMPSVDSWTAIIQDGRRRVAEGDTILLRFTDGGTGRIIRYTIGGPENDLSKGVIATTDQRAVCLIGKGVGDAVELELPTVCRQAAIVKIWQGLNRQPLPLVKPKKVQASNFSTGRTDRSSQVISCSYTT